MAKTEKYTILHGPTKFDLMMAFFDGDHTCRRRLKFKIEKPDNSVLNKIQIIAEAVINKIEWEDGSGNSWNMEGLFQINDTSFKGSAYYSTKKLSGHLSINIG